MLLTDYLTPENIQQLYKDISKALVEKQAGEREIKAIKVELDNLQAPIVNSPDFKAEKNQALQEKLWRGMFSDKYFIMDKFQARVDELNDLLQQYRETRDEYRLLVDYFKVLSD